MIKKATLIAGLIDCVLFFLCEAVRVCAHDALMTGGEVILFILAFAYIMLFTYANMDLIAGWLDRKLG